MFVVESAARVSLRMSLKVLGVFARVAKRRAHHSGNRHY